jgi:hypothetical protein
MAACEKPNSVRDEIGVDLMYIDIKIYREIFI